MDSQTRPIPLDRLLDEVYRDRDWATRSEIRERALGMNLPPALLARIEALPETEFTREELIAVLPADDPRLWRSAGRTAQPELRRARRGIGASTGV